MDSAIVREKKIHDTSIALDIPLYFFPPIFENHHEFVPPFAEVPRICASAFVLARFFSSKFCHFRLNKLYRFLYGGYRGWLDVLFVYRCVGSECVCQRGRYTGTYFTAEPSTLGLARYILHLKQAIFLRCLMVRHGKSCAGKRCGVIYG